MTRGEPHPLRFNRVSFITLNQNKLFTASQVADLVEEYSSANNPAAEREKVLDECHWKLNDEYFTYETDCGHSFQFTDGDLEDNGGFEFCPYCGKKIAEQLRQQGEQKGCRLIEGDR